MAIEKYIKINLFKYTKLKKCVTIIDEWGII